MLLAQMKANQRNILVQIPKQDKMVETLLCNLTTDYHFNGFINPELIKPIDGEIKTLKNFINDKVKDGWDYFVNKPHVDQAIDQLNNYLN